MILSHLLKKIIKEKRETILLTLFFFSFYITVNNIIEQIDISIIKGRIIVFFQIFYRLCSEEVNYSDELLYQFLLFIFIKIVLIVGLTAKLATNKKIKTIIGIFYTIDFIYIFLYYGVLILGVHPRNLNYLFTPLAPLYLFSYMFQLPAFVGFLISASSCLFAHRIFTKITLIEFYYWVIISFTSFGTFLIFSKLFFLVKRVITE
jgi:hypothetical protein